MVDADPVFVAEETTLPLPYEQARARLLDYVRVDGLQSSSEDAFEQGRELLVRAGVGAVSKQVLVQLLQPYEHEAVTVVPLRWVATGAAGTMFPQLDGNLELAPADGEQSILRLAGAYRAPLAAVGATLDRVLLHRVADASVGRFLEDVVEDLCEGLGDDVVWTHEVRPTPDRG